MTNKEIMRSALGKYVIAPLREKGFTGTWPHFRRVLPEAIELITFQSNKWGGSFTVELSAVFPNSEDTNYVEWKGLDKEKPTAWDTNRRYRLKGMYNGWFYYWDLYAKHIWGLGKDFLDVSEKETANFIVPKGYKPVQIFNEDTAAEICKEVNKQLEQGFRWLEKFEKKQRRDFHAPI